MKNEAVSKRRIENRPIPLSAPTLGGNELQYIRECLETNWVSTAGPFVDRFEHDTAAYTGVDYAVAVVNGTAALHTALMVAGVEPDDEVLTSTLSFVAPANAVRYTGAWPRLIDAEPDYWQMDVEKLRVFLDTYAAMRNGRLVNRSSGRRIRAILPVHILGHPVDMDPLLEIAQTYELTVIEDAAEALGAEYNRRKTGTFGDAACLSFNGNKLITTGGGGMVLTNRRDWADRARYLTTQAKDDPVEYVHHEVGYNYRLTNLLAAFGCAQLESIDHYIAAKKRIARTYDEAFQHVPGLIPMREAPWASSTWWLYTIVVDEERCGISRTELARVLAEQNIQTRPLWTPLHLNPPFRGLAADSCPVSEQIQRTALSLPSSVSLTEDDQERVIRSIAEAVNR